MPAAKTSPPWWTMISAKTIAGIADHDPRREVRPCPPASRRCGHAYRPPNRRRRAAYSSSDASNASREKSGHSSSRNTNSE